MSELSFTVSETGQIGLDPLEPPTQGPAQSAVPRPAGNKAREAYDKKRRPQAAVLYRALREKTSRGMSWKECWALGEGNEEWDVGPIIVWMRSQKVEVIAKYDPVVGETRFYLSDVFIGVGVSGGS